MERDGILQAGGSRCNREEVRPRKRRRCRGRGARLGSTMAAKSDSDVVARKGEEEGEVGRERWGGQSLQRAACVTRRRRAGEEVKEACAQETREGWTGWRELAAKEGDGWGWSTRRGRLVQRVDLVGVVGELGGPQVAGWYTARSCAASARAGTGRWRGVEEDEMGWRERGQAEWWGWGEVKVIWS